MDPSEQICLFPAFLNTAMVLNVKQVPLAACNGCLAYFAQLNIGIITLYCLFWWYLWILFIFFPFMYLVWINTAIVTAVVGTGLNLNAKPIGFNLSYIRSVPWVVFRFYFIPFCVSSYSGIVMQQSEDFVSVFPKRWFVVITGVTFIVTWLLWVYSCKTLYYQVC